MPELRPPHSLHGSAIWNEPAALEARVVSWLLNSHLCAPEQAPTALCFSSLDTAQAITLVPNEPRDPLCEPDTNSYLETFPVPNGL